MAKASKIKSQAKATPKTKAKKIDGETFLIGDAPTIEPALMPKVFDSTLLQAWERNESVPCAKDESK